MAEIWGAALVVAGTVYSTEQQKKAARAQGRNANAAMAASQQNYDQTKADLQPYIDLGGNAAGTLGALSHGDFSSFHADPGYRFAFDQGLQGLDRSAAARGSLFSGGHSADLIKYGQGMADQQYGSFYDRLMGLAQLGQGASANLGSVGTGNAASIGGYLTGAKTDSAINSANADTNMAGQLVSLIGQYRGQQGAPTNSSYSLGGNGAETYQNINNGTLNNGTFDFTRNSGGTY